jgi:cytochrome c553
VTSATPPPISGGTLLVTSNDVAVAADSDRDVVYVVDLGSEAVSTIALQPGDEPGRVIQDGRGRVHVALRRAGAVATLDLESKSVVARTPVCSAPRGLGFDATRNAIVVACAGGELVTLDADSNAVVQSVRFAGRDLRDVIVGDGQLFVTRFRSAELLTFSLTGELIAEASPPAISDPSALGATFTPTTAWRAVVQPGVGTFVVHQYAADSSVVISQPGGYGSDATSQTGCSSTIVQTAISFFDTTGASTGVPAPVLTGASVPVDLATDGNGTFVIASAGADALFVTTNAQLESAGACSPPSSVPLLGQPVAVASARLGFVAQIREVTPGSGQGPALVLSDGNVVTTTIPLPGASMANTGHSLFHHNASATSSLACASCHAEGHEDGHVWVFDTLGSRRTQTVSGGVLATAPLHWNGDMSDLTDIMHEVFEQRMSGNPLEAGPLHVEAFGEWLNTIPAYPPSPTGTAAQIARGKQLFESSAVGCSNCHNGPHLTNNQTVAVGTGQAFQVPTLVGVAARAPFMHDGCASTLTARFDPTLAACNGGEQHGSTAQLSATDVADLVAYLETL